MTGISNCQRVPGKGHDTFSNSVARKNMNLRRGFPTTPPGEEQSAAGLVSCPVCGETHVNKAIMAPAVSSSRPPCEQQSP